MSVWCQSVITLSSVFNRSTCITHVLRMWRLELLLRYACITLALHLRYAGVTLVLRLRYAWVTLGLRLGYAWVTLGLRLRYACKFNINIKLSRQLSVSHQSDVSLSSLCRLSSIGQHALCMCYACEGLSYSCVTLALRLRYAGVTLVLRLRYAWVTLGLRLGYAWVTLGLRLRYACKFNINIKLSRQLSVSHQSDVSLMSVCHHSVICLQ
jgi:hypothetical protein